MAARLATSASALLAAYGQVAPPAIGKAEALADALLLVFPTLFANGVAENLVHADAQAHQPYPPGELRGHHA